MKPIQVNKNNEKYIKENIYTYSKTSKNPKFKIGDLYFSQKQLPSAWNESDWLTNCRPIHIVKLLENRKRFS